MAVLRAAAVLVLVGALGACGQQPAGAPDPAPSPDLPGDPGALVLQVDRVGGFTQPGADAGRLPLVSVHADGRVFGQGPVAAIYRGFAWPNVQVRQVPVGQVQELVELALDAGVADTADLGSPPVADAPSTRFTVVTAEERFVREAYALSEGMGAGGLSAEQEAARAELQELLDRLLGVAQPGDGSPQVYEPAAVAAVVRPWTAPEDDGSGVDFAGPPQPWPGPALPGEPIGPDVSCVVATGEQAVAVREAAGAATVLTPWSSAGGTWSVTFRPLLPHESTCADLTG
ncbi:hypothetical protein [Blastococcus sp. TF02A-30]|uniref:hypothetical protein n=1 Tax=Blastococcus sp. TF02A-30 TaxID=2250580 RepID=UPI000DE8A30B|nr:hypothetical protein [Blastococcus sp. TF02A-30]RBY86401.1 hypothetical protein DQ241_12715 [Blastococcus sp. TF02A-30]